MPGYLERLFRHASLELGVAIGALLTLAGAAAVAGAFWSWSAVGFGALDPRLTMRQLIPGAILLVIGIQTVFSSFFLSVLGIRRRSRRAAA